MAKAPPRGALGEAFLGRFGREGRGGPMRASPEGPGPGLGGSHYRVPCRPKAEASTSLESSWKVLSPTPASPHSPELMGR